jgi:5-methylcytosine-specific restriction endonuclease McrA
VREIAKLRGGMVAEERDALKTLHRHAVMARWGRTAYVNKSGGYSWRGECLKCGKERPLQTAHVEPVGRVRALQYDVDNAVPLCGGCHIHWWHKFPRQAEAWIVTVIGQEKRDALARKADGVDEDGMKLPPDVLERPCYGAIRLDLEREIRRTAPAMAEDLIASAA